VIERAPSGVGVYASDNCFISDSACAVDIMIRRLQSFFSVFYAVTAQVLSLTHMALAYASESLNAHFESGSVSLHLASSGHLFLFQKVHGLLSAAKYVVGGQSRVLFVVAMRAAPHHKVKRSNTHNR
jgi:hypothetical protein